MPVFPRVAGAAVRVVAPAELLTGPGGVVLVGILVLPGTRAAEWAVPRSAEWAVPRSAEWAVRRGPPNGP